MISGAHAWIFFKYYIHTHLMALLSGLPGSAGKTNLDFTEARDSEWQWHQLGHMQVCTLLQTDNHASTPQLRKILLLIIIIITIHFIVQC